MVQASDYVIVKQPAKTRSVCDRPEQGLQVRLGISLLAWQLLDGVICLALQMRLLSV